MLVIKLAKCFLVSTATVKRWSLLWESTGDDALFDHRSIQEEQDPPLLFASPPLVFELSCWIQDRLKQRGKHDDGYLTIKNYINDVLFNDPDVVSPELLDMHEARYHSQQVSQMTVLRWIHKLGFKWADSYILCQT